MGKFFNTYNKLAAADGLENFFIGTGGIFVKTLKLPKPKILKGQPGYVPVQTLDTISGFQKHALQTLKEKADQKYAIAKTYENDGHPRKAKEYKDKAAKAYKKAFEKKALGAQVLGTYKIDHITTYKILLDRDVKVGDEIDINGKKMKISKLGKFRAGLIDYAKAGEEVQIQGIFEKKAFEKKALSTELLLRAAKRAKELGKGPQAARLTNVVILRNNKEILDKFQEAARILEIGRLSK